MVGGMYIEPKTQMNLGKHLITQCLNLGARPGDA